MGGDARLTIKTLEAEGWLAKGEAQGWMEGPCKAGCSTWARMLVVLPHERHTLHPEGAAVLHRALCVGCKHEWLTNTRPKGYRGAWDDMNDPTVRKRVPSK